MKLTTTPLNVNLPYCRSLMNQARLELQQARNRAARDRALHYMSQWGRTMNECKVLKARLANLIKWVAYGLEQRAAERSIAA